MPKSVLVADDSATMRKIIGMVFSTEDFQLTVVDNDVMSHKLVKTSGPAVRYRPGAAMRHMSASVRVTFGKAGVYKFTTKPGEDYPGMAMKTIGEDNVLRLTVRVTG